MAQKTLSKTALPKSMRLRGINIEIQKIKDQLSDPSITKTKRTSLTAKLSSLMDEKNNM